MPRPGKAEPVQPVLTFGLAGFDAPLLEELSGDGAVDAESIRTVLTVAAGTGEELDLGWNDARDGYEEATVVVGDDAIAIDVSDRRPRRIPLRQIEWVGLPEGDLVEAGW